MHACILLYTNMQFPLQSIDYTSGFRVKRRKHEVYHAIIDDAGGHNASRSRYFILYPSQLRLLLL